MIGFVNRTTGSIKINKLTKTEKLYGINVDTLAWETMLYPDVLRLKARLAHERIGVLNEAHYMEKDSANVTACVNAGKFNEKLLKEVYDGPRNKS